MGSINTPCEFWKEVRKYRRRFNNTGDIPAQEWHDHFKTILNENVTVPNDNINPSDRVDDEFLDAPITSSEVKKAINHLKLRKAAGPDGILNEMLKSSESVIITYIVKLFNTIFSTGLYPKEWTKAIIIPLHKKGPTNAPDNFRGISLLSTLSKVFTAVLNSRLASWSESNDVIDESQAGFRKGRSTIDHIFTLHAVVEKQLSQNKKLYAAYIDFRKAYDSVNRSLLWVVLHEAGVKGKMLDILRNMYENVKACVRCDDGKCTDSFGA